MNLSFSIAPSALLWTDDLFNAIQAVKAGTFDTSEVYTQFGWLVVPEYVGHSASGPIDIYFAIKAPDPTSQEFSFLAPITQISVWSVVNHLPVASMLYASGLDLAFLDVLAAPTALALEKLLFRDDDVFSSGLDRIETANDVLHGWDGDDIFQITANGGTDRYYGGDGNDWISIWDGAAGTMHGRAQHFFGYGDAGHDTLQGDDLGDQLFGGTGNDSLSGFEGRDTLQGGFGRDTLTGGAGNDSLGGGDGNDLLNGGLGVDRMAGGAGADLFIFTWGGTVPHYDSGLERGTRDVITDFKPGVDKLRPLESGLAHMTLIGSDAFTGANQIRWVKVGADTVVFVNGDAGLGADMAITLLGVNGLLASDFAGI